MLLNSYRTSAGKNQTTGYKPILDYSFKADSLDMSADSISAG